MSNVEWRQKGISKIRPRNLYLYRPGKVNEKGKYRDIEAINKLKMWASNPLKYNDPFECSMGLDVQDLVQIAGLSLDIDTQELRKHIGKECNQWVSALDFRKEFLTGCLSENLNCIPLWGYYANDCKGFCIEYDFNAVFDLYNLLPVIYTDRINPMKHF